MGWKQRIYAGVAAAETALFLRSGREEFRAAGPAYLPGKYTMNIPFPPRAVGIFA